MRYGCAGGQSRAGRTPRVGEEVQDLYGASCRSDQVSAPVPVRCLLGKKPGVLEAERFQIECKTFISDLPGFGQIEEIPAPSALFAPVIMSVRRFPFFPAGRRLPDDLRVWADENIVSPALELFAIPCIKYVIVFPVVGNPHVFKTSVSPAVCAAEKQP